MSKNIEIKWLSEPEDHDYPAALSYLSLIYDEPAAKTSVEKLKRQRFPSSRPRTFSGRPLCHCWGSATRTWTRIERRSKPAASCRLSSWSGTQTMGKSSLPTGTIACARSTPLMKMR